MGTHPIFESDFDCLTVYLSREKTKMSAAAKQLRIQTGVVNRTFKEKNYYTKELTEFSDKLKQNNFATEEEQYRAKIIPQQIDETKAALKDTEERLETAIETLKKYVEQEGNDKQSKEWIAANEKFNEVKEALAC